MSCLFETKQIRQVHDTKRAAKLRNYYMGSDIGWTLRGGGGEQGNIYHS